VPCDERAIRREERSSRCEERPAVARNGRPAAPPARARGASRCWSAGCPGTFQIGQDPAEPSQLVI